MLSKHGREGEGGDEALVTVSWRKRRQAPPPPRGRAAGKRDPSWVPQYSRRPALKGTRAIKALGSAGPPRGPERGRRRREGGRPSGHQIDLEIRASPQRAGAVRERRTCGLLLSLRGLWARCFSLLAAPKARDEPGPLFRYYLFLLTESQCL